MIGIIGAMDIEINGLKEKMSDKTTDSISSTVYTVGKIYSKECVIAKCGVGKVNSAIVAQTMILKYKPDIIINTGVAGGTSKTVHVGDVVIAESVVQHDMDTTALGDEVGTLFLPDDSSIKYIPCDRELTDKLAQVCKNLGEKGCVVGAVATGDSFISGREQRDALNKGFNALACEMEGGSIGQVCFLNKVPFAVLRSISDSMSSEDDKTEYSTFSKAAAEKAVHIILSLLQCL